MFTASRSLVTTFTPIMRLTESEEHVRLVVRAVRYLR